jgi:D-ribulokinase
MARSGDFLLGVDVGTGSARAGVFDRQGRLLGTAKHDIAMHRDTGGIVEQSGEDIWRAVCAAARGAVAQAGIAPADIRGISFDATCSLVVLGEGGVPLPVSDPAHPERDIIVWMDHRARGQAARINADRATGCCDIVGGRISPEMQTPKLLWLAENRPEIYAAPRNSSTDRFPDLEGLGRWIAFGLHGDVQMDLSGRMKAAGMPAISARSALAIWPIRLCAHRYAGRQIPGTPLGQGLTAGAAADLGLPGTAVGGGADRRPCRWRGHGRCGGRRCGAEPNLGYVFGTSSCTMTTTREPVFAPGVWGPYFSAMVPGMWLNEGGQSAAGAAIDQLVRLHPFSAEARDMAHAAGLSLPAWLAREVETRAQGGDPVDLARGLHVVPEFLGNRSPHADPDTRAVIAGLGMDRGLDSLIALYIAGICGIGYGLRQIVDAQARAGAPVGRVVISGGAGRSDMIRQLMADASGIEFAATESEEPVLLGTAMLGAVAGGVYPDLTTAMRAMSRLSRLYPPKGGEVAARHDQRYLIWEALQTTARAATTV